MLDALFHKLHSNGVGIQVKLAEIITEADEDKVWTSGIIGVSSPSSLQNAAFYVLGKRLVCEEESSAGISRCHS